MEGQYSIPIWKLFSLMLLVNLTNRTACTCQEGVLLSQTGKGISQLTVSQLTDKPDRQTDRQTDRQIDRQTDRQTAKTKVPTDSKPTDSAWRWNFPPQAPHVAAASTMSSNVESWCSRSISCWKCASFSMSVSTVMSRNCGVNSSVPVIPCETMCHRQSPFSNKVPSGKGSKNVV